MSKSKKYCGRCGSTDESKLTQVSKCRSRVYYRCRDCENARRRAYYQTPKGKEAARRANQRYMAKKRAATARETSPSEEWTSAAQRSHDLILAHHP